MKEYTIQLRVRVRTADGERRTYASMADVRVTPDGRLVRWRKPSWRPAEMVPTPGDAVRRSRIYHLGRS